MPDETSIGSTSSLPPKAGVSDPFARFRAWYSEAEAAGGFDTSRMALATVDAAGRPHVRMVLLKAFGESGFVFYTNLGSPKARDLALQPVAELCLHWPEIDRQVRVSGSVIRVSDEEADAYWASRPRLSQLGGWASRQSERMEGFWELEKAVAMTALRYPLGSVPRPPHWSGFRVVPDRIEFWHQKPFRHHERTVFVLKDGSWSEEWLYP